MAKVTHPLNSFRARGRFAGTLDFRDYPAGETFSSRAYIQLARKKPGGISQKIKETNLKLAASTWTNLSLTEKQSWEFVAFDYRNYGAEYVWRPELPAYHKFMSYNLQRLAAGVDIMRHFDQAIILGLFEIAAPTISESGFLIESPDGHRTLDLAEFIPSLSAFSTTTIPGFSHISPLLEIIPTLEVIVSLS